MYKIGEFMSSDTGGVALTKIMGRTDEHTEGRVFMRTDRQRQHIMPYVIKNGSGLKNIFLYSTDFRTSEKPNIVNSQKKHTLIYLKI